MPSETLNFSRRARLSELMDEPCSYAEFRDGMHDLVSVNRTVFSYRPTLNWLGQFTGSANTPLHIVDVGSGAGDMLRKIDAWARRNKVPVRLTGLDRNPFSARAAQEFGNHNGSIEWITSDVLDYEPPSKVDLVISSLFAHHLTDQEIVDFLRWMERTTTRGWFVNDLHRARVPYYAFKLLAHGMRWHRFVRNDGPVSIRRSFSAYDWDGYVRDASLASEDVRIFTTWPGRLCVAREKR